MMIRPVILEAIKRGEVDLAFRRWERPRVVVGTRLRTSVGVVEVTSVDRVPPSRLSAADARRSGAPSLAALRSLTENNPERPLWRVGLRFAGADPRAVLREQLPSADELEMIRASLDRLDRASSFGHWTRATLTAIDLNPAVRAPELAAGFGRETAEFKKDVRKLKELGLTESLDVGYRLSPRGVAVVDAENGPRERGPGPSGTRLPKIGAPATKALAAVGISTLEELTRLSEKHVAALHGVGPFALTRLRSALDEAGLDYAPAS